MALPDLKSGLTATQMAETIARGAAAGQLNMQPGLPVMPMIGQHAPTPPWIRVNHLPPTGGTITGILSSGEFPDHLTVGGPSGGTRTYVPVEQLDRIQEQLIELKAKLGNLGVISPPLSEAAEDAMIRQRWLDRQDIERMNWSANKIKWALKIFDEMDRKIVANVSLFHLAIIVCGALKEMIDANTE